MQGFEMRNISFAKKKKLRKLNPCRMC